METGGPWGLLASWSKQSKWYLKEHIRFPSGSDMLFVHMNIHKKKKKNPKVNQTEISVFKKIPLNLNLGVVLVFRNQMCKLRETAPKCG